MATITFFKRFPVTDLFEEYKNDIRWIKTFYLPIQMSSIDILFTVPLTSVQKEAFQDEETRLFNLIMKNNTPEHGQYTSNKPPLDLEKLTKLDYKSFSFALSADYFHFPDKSIIFETRIHKFFELIKVWTKAEFINIDMTFLREYINDAKIFKEIQIKLTEMFQMATNLKKNQSSRLTSLTNNLEVYQNDFSKKFPNKIVFVSPEVDLENSANLLKKMVEFVIAKGIFKLAKCNQEKVKNFISNELINHMVNRCTGTWTKINYYLKILNKGLFQGPILDIMDDTEFQNLHKLLPLVYGPTTYNFRFYSRIIIIYN